MIEKIAHIGIAVRDLDAQIPYYRDVLGLQFLGCEDVLQQGVRTALFAAGETMIELLAPLFATSPIARFLDKRGEGFHHLAFEVEELAQALDALRGKGIRLVDEQPRPGAHGAVVAFAHPRSTHGVLTEFCQHGESRAETEIRSGGANAAE